MLGASALIASSDSLGGFDTYGSRGEYLWQIYPYVVFRSYWATFGWLHIVAAPWVYLLLFALCWTGLLGLLLGWRDERRRMPEPTSDAAFDALRRVDPGFHDPAAVVTPDRLIVGPRVGVAYAGEPWAARPWRFSIAGHRSVSGPVRGSRAGSRQPARPPTD